MNKNNFEIKELVAKDLHQYNELLRYAFQLTEKTLHEHGWKNDEIKLSKFPILERANVWGCFDGEELVSQFAVYPLKMNIHSVAYSIGFVTSVATYPEYSGLGLMKKLMKRGLTEMRENKQTLSLLYPFSIPLYRKRGWEIISEKMSFSIKDTQLPKKLKAPGYVRRVDWQNQDFRNLHTQFAQQTHGCLYRNHLAWDEYWRWDDDDTIVAIYYSKDDKPLGYMVYLIKNDIMHIKEMIYLNTEARRGLMQYLSAHESMINEVRGSNYSGEPIAFSLDDSEIKETIRPYIMGRIVDLEEFLKKYSFREEAKGKISLEITDPFLEWNCKKITLDISDGHCEISREDVKNCAAMSIGTLTTLLMGYKSASNFVKLERIEADSKAIEFLDSAIIYEQPCISDYI